MNTALLVEQLTIAIVASAIVIPTIQRMKGWMSTDKMVELVSVLASFTIGSGVAIYYASFGLIDGLIVGFFSVIGAESIYKLLHDKLKTFDDINHTGNDSVSPLLLEAEEAHLMGDMNE